MSSCGYHAQRPSFSHVSVQVPFIPGDDLGVLNRNLVYQITHRGMFTYDPHCGQAALVVDNLELTGCNIGYRFEMTPAGKRKNLVIPNENRLIATCSVSLVDASTGKIITGPAEVEAFHDYDYDFFADFEDITVFSQGQIEEGLAAHELAQDPLFEKLADNITREILTW